MNISNEVDDILGDTGYIFQRLQLFTSPVAVSISSFVFTLFYKRNVYHDNFRLLVQALTISLFSNNLKILIHSYSLLKNNTFEFNEIKDHDIDELKGNIHICDKYSPIPVPLMFINVASLFVLVVERNIAIYTFGRYEKLQFNNLIYTFSIPLWIFCLLLIAYDYSAICGIENNLLFNFCHSVFVQKYYWNFSLPYVSIIPPLLLVTIIFIKNYKCAKIQAASQNNNVEDYLSARFQITENIRSNALLAIFSFLLSTITLIYTLGLYVINNPQPKTITFFIEMANLLFSLFTIGFFITMIRMTPVFYNKISRFFNNFMKIILSLCLCRSNYCSNMVKKIKFLKK